jgi:multidrug efflux pump subunit AcrA (membrane-fusion protein)
MHHAADLGELATARSSLSVGALQAAMQRAFAPGAASALQSSLQSSLAEIGRHFDGVYVGFRADFGGVHHSANWSWEGFDAVEGLRESLGTTIADVMSTRRARLTPLAGEASPTILAVPVFDAAHEVVGAACAVVGPCEPDRATDVLAMFESVAGYLALLLAAVAAPTADPGLHFGLPDGIESRADDPLFLAYAMAAELRNHRGLDQVLVGFVRGGRVRVAAISGIDEVRRSNPGVKIVAQAMEECLDRGAPVRHPARGERSHLHEQWSHSVAGGAVASFPLRQGSETIAIVSVRKATVDGLTEEDVAELERDIQPFARLLPVSRLASRGLISHAAERVASGLKRVFGPKNFKSRAGLVAATLFALWLVFGSMSYSFTVPCAVVPAKPRTIACPREGLLRELYVRPGDRVQRGDILARLDTEDERLEEASIVADVRRQTAMIDRARADGKPGDARIYEAQRAAEEARLDLVRLRLTRSEIRAPADGRILQGDLDRIVGSKIAMGQALFQLAHGDEVQVELRIPERHVWDAREFELATFAPSARPAEQFALTSVSIHPTSSATDGQNFFVARSTPFSPPQNLTPGMEGVVHMEVGERSTWWVLTHRITDWMRLRFWF